MKNVGRKKNVAEEKKEVEKMDSEEAVRIRESLPQAYPPGLQKSVGLTGKMKSPRPVENAAEM
jgi:hypothetical protein